MTNGTNIARDKYPLLKHLVLIQVGAVILGVLFLFLSYRLVSALKFRAALEHAKETIVGELTPRHEEVRAFKTFGMDAVVEESIAKWKASYPLAKVELVPIASVPKRLDETEFVVPREFDGLVNFVILGKLDVAQIPARSGLAGVNLPLFLGFLGLYILLILWSFRYIKSKIYNPIHELNTEFEELAQTGSLDIDGIEASGEVKSFLMRVKSLYLRAQEYERRQISEEVYSQVAHDIRSPLLVLQALEPILHGVPDDKRKLLRQAIQRVGDVANTVLAKKTAKDPWEPATVEDLASIVGSLIAEKTLQYQNLKGIRFHYTSSAPVYVLVHKSQLYRVLSNVINNAVEACPDGGEIHLALDASQSGKAILSIKDNGIGIEEEFLEKVFDSGFSKGKTEGFGLGLHHAKTQIELWKGTIKVSSSSQAGTQITIELPTAHKDEAYEETHSIS